MQSQARGRTLSKELKKLELRAEDRGAIKGEFEHHFGVILDRNLVITQELCAKWNIRCSALFKKRNMGPDQESSELDNLFQKFFKVSLPAGKHLTPEMCYSWRDKHQGYLIAIWIKRSQARRAQDKNDSG